VFEFDPDKSLSNNAKHGIDFETAQTLWTDDNRIEIDARSNTEPRIAVVGLIEGKLWTAFITVRGEAIRIISVRRARNDEAEAYDRRKNN